MNFTTNYFELTWNFTILSEKPCGFADKKFLSPNRFLSAEIADKNSLPTETAILLE